MFRTGQKVVCIDPTWGAPTGSELQKARCPNLPTKGAVYRIRSTHFLQVYQGKPSQWFVRLYEVVNPTLPDGHGKDAEAIFDAKKYRPLDERKTDISVLKQLLVPKKRKLTT